MSFQSTLLWRWEHMKKQWLVAHLNDVNNAFLHCPFFGITTEIYAAYGENAVFIIGDVVEQQTLGPHSPRQLSTI